MTEIEIKKLLVSSLIENPNIDAIGSEVPFLFGRRRADVISISNSIVTGYEVKSENDNVSVLAKQLKDYRLYFDAIVVVCEPGNIKKVRAVMPQWAGLYVVTEDSLKTLRSPKTFKMQNKMALLSTLTSMQLRSVSKPSINVSNSNHELCQLLTKSKKFSEIKSLSRSSLKNRYQLPTQILRKESFKRLNSDDLITITKPQSSAFRKS
ncbi:sce7726 family protein [Alteromonas australica]|uniref:sce7726 family protein n=1 Tax=Alteromonas australica TaxID=589873 RepID=UPI0039C88241